VELERIATEVAVYRAELPDWTEAAEVGREAIGRRKIKNRRPVTCACRTINSRVG